MRSVLLAYCFTATIALRLKVDVVDNEQHQVQSTLENVQSVQSEIRRRLHVQHVKAAGQEQFFAHGRSKEDVETKKTSARDQALSFEIAMKASNNFRSCFHVIFDFLDFNTQRGWVACQLLSEHGFAQLDMVKPQIVKAGILTEPFYQFLKQVRAHFDSKYGDEDWAGADDQIGVARRCDFPIDRFSRLIFK